MIIEFCASQYMIGRCYKTMYCCQDHGLMLHPLRHRLHQADLLLNKPGIHRKWRKAGPIPGSPDSRIIGTGVFIHDLAQVRTAGFKKIQMNLHSLISRLTAFRKMIPEPTWNTVRYPAVYSCHYSLVFIHCINTFLLFSKYFQNKFDF